MKKDELLVKSTGRKIYDKNKPVRDQLDCYVDDEQLTTAFRQLGNYLAESVRPSVEAMNALQEALKPTYEAIESTYEVTRVLTDSLRAHGEQFSLITVPIRDLLLAFSDRGITDGNSAIKSELVDEDPKNNALILQTTTTTAKDGLIHQEKQIIEAKLDENSKKLDELLAIAKQSKETTREEVEKWLAKNGMIAVVVKIKTLKRQASNLIINGKVVSFEAGSDQDKFIAAFFNKEKLDEDICEDGLDFDQLHKIFGGEHDSKELKVKARKKYQDLKLQVNKRVQTEAYLPNFIVYEKELGCWKINPEYLI